jgi:hypothetical protein
LADWQKQLQALVEVFLASLVSPVAESSPKSAGLEWLQLPCDYDLVAKSFKNLIGYGTCQRQSSMNPICHHILGLCFAYRSCYPCYIPRKNPDKHLSSMFLGDMSLCVTISRAIVGGMVKRILYLLPHSPASVLRHARSSSMHEAFPLLGPHSPLGERIG